MILEDRRGVETELHLGEGAAQVAVSVEPAQPEAGREAQAAVAHGPYRLPLPLRRAAVDADLSARCLRGRWRLLRQHTLKAGGSSMVGIKHVMTSDPLCKQGFCSKGEEGMGQELNVMEFSYMHTAKP